MTLHPHSPDRPFTWQLPHDYDPQATCPMTQAWLHEAVGGAHDQVQVLRAYAKAVVTRRVDLQRYLETLGPGGTGKGTYTRLLMALVGCENTVATELKHLEANRFELSQLRGKVLMVITDAERYSGPVNALKAITGQDFVRMEEKFKAQRTEVAPVMVVVAANEPVQSADYTSGLVRRRLSMAFRHRPAVPRDLLSWRAGAWQGALAPEIPGVLNWVLALPDAQMEALLQQTTTLVPSLQATWAWAWWIPTRLPSGPTRHCSSMPTRMPRGTPWRSSMSGVPTSWTRAMATNIRIAGSTRITAPGSMIPAARPCPPGALQASSETSLRISCVSTAWNTATTTRGHGFAASACVPTRIPTSRASSPIIPRR